MGDTWLTDMTHFLDGTGEVPKTAGPVGRMRDYLGAIVTSVTTRRVVEGDRTLVKCRRRPGHKPCRGRIRARIDPASHEILWKCPLCHDRGMILGWENTPWDLTNQEAPVGAEGVVPARLASTDSVVAGSFSEPRTAPALTRPKFTAPAQRRWDAVDARLRIRILNNVFCVTCRGNCSMQLLEGRVRSGELVLHGRCVKCGGPVARVVEGR